MLRTIEEIQRLHGLFSLLTKCQFGPGVLRGKRVDQAGELHGAKNLTLTTSPVEIIRNVSLKIRINKAR
jgi:hypothetical protein